MKKIIYLMITITLFAELSCYEFVSPPRDNVNDVSIYTVAFDSQGGSEVPSQTLSKFDKIVEPVNPVKTGDIFLGWYKEAAYITMWNFTTDSVFRIPSYTLYARWLSGIQYNDFATVTGGTFIESDGGNSFNHTISAFKIAKYEVTYELWNAVYQWAITHGYKFANSGREGNDGTIGSTPTTARYEPVTFINWFDAIVWCNAYSEISGLTPCYTYSGAVIRDSRDSNLDVCNNSACVWTNNGYRLPSEGEWRCAASWKGADSSNGSIEFPVSSGNYWTPPNYVTGDTAPFYESHNIGNYAWWNGNSSGSTHVVGTKTANALGIHDMSGNVLEFSWDWSKEWPTDPQTDYRGPVSAACRVIQGGSWLGGADTQPIGYGKYIYANEEGTGLGIRIAKSN